MVVRSSGWVVGLVLWGWTGSAAAGGGSSTGDTSGTDTGQTEGTGSSSGGLESSGDEGCGGCPPGLDEGSIAVRNFEDGQSYMEAIPLDLTASPACQCDDCGCYAAGAYELRVLEGEVSHATCPGGQCVIEVPLPVGPHVLTIVAAYDFHEVTRDLSFSIVPPQDEGPTTDGSGGAGTVGGSEGGGAEGSGGGGDSGSAGGCGCGSPGSGFAATPLALLWLGRRRRR